MQTGSVISIMIVFFSSPNYDFSYSCSISTLCMHKRQLCPKLILAPTQCDCWHPLTNKMMMLIILPIGIAKTFRTYMMMVVIMLLMMFLKKYLLAKTYLICGKLDIEISID